MKTLQIVAVLFTLALLSPWASGAQRLSIKVSPVVALAPASLTIRAAIEPSDENRMLSIEVDSDTYHSVSEIPLEGKLSQRIAMHEVKRLPSGLYEVRGILKGSSGPIASSIQMVRIQPSPGHN